MELFFGNNALIEDFTDDQRCQLIEQLLDEKVGLSQYVKSKPTTDAGNEILTSAADMLFGEIEDGRVNRALAAASQDLENELDELVCCALDNEYLKLGHDIEQIVTSEILAILTSFEARLAGKVSNTIEDQFFGKTRPLLRDLSDTCALMKLRVQISHVLPSLVRNAVTWKTDTTELRTVLTQHMREFIDQAVLANVSLNIRGMEFDAKYEIGASSDFKGPVLQADQAAVDSVEGASHG